MSIELETLLASAPREQTARGPATEASLRLGLEQAGLQADVTAPGPDGRWRLSLEDARAEPLLRWLLTQPGRLSLRPDRIDLRRIDAPAAGSRPAVTVLEVRVGRRVANRNVASGSVPRIDRVVPATRNER